MLKCMLKLGIEWSLSSPFLLLSRDSLVAVVWVISILMKLLVTVRDIVQIMAQCICLVIGMDDLSLSLISPLSPYSP